VNAHNLILLKEWMLCGWMSFLWYYKNEGFYVSNKLIW